MKQVSDDELTAARVAWPDMPEELLEDAVRKAEDAVDRMTKDRDGRKESARRARKERIQADMADITDFHSETEAICPSCGSSEEVNTDGLARGWMVWVCPDCDNEFEVRIEPRYLFTSRPREEMPSTDESEKQSGS